MKLETSKGKVFETQVITTALRNPNKVLIKLEDGRTLAEIAADFDGLETLRIHETESIYQTYEGFSRLVGIQREETGDSVRLTLAKP